MAYPVTGSPTQALVDAIRVTLTGDATLMALVTGVFGHLSEAARTAYPYIVLGRRSRNNDGGAMQIAGGLATLQLDVWSDHNGPSQVHAIQSRVSVLLERRSLSLTGFSLRPGSLTCELEEVFDEDDPDSPDRLLYHGVQRWTGDVEEVAA